ncbi:MAG: histidine phosphatase family protein [Alphaproteobacteria bacterium]
MTRLALIRHAATAWSEGGRIQGRADLPLSPRGREAAARRRPPPELAGADWVSSPLARAYETARLMGAASIAREPRLIEMDWGRWEGRRLADLRAELGAAMAANEARGLDFRPDGGESPRDVQERIAPWLAAVAGRGRPVAAVTHKGVIRAVLALASGWDMTGKPPARLAWDCAHLFTLARDGAPAVERLNRRLAAS